jgi:hypothetical protein
MGFAVSRRASGGVWRGGGRKQRKEGAEELEPLAPRVAPTVPQANLCTGTGPGRAEEERVGGCCIQKIVSQCSKVQRR